MVKNCLYAFQQGYAVHAVKYKYPDDPAKMTVTKYPAVISGYYLHHFSLTVYRSNFILLTGGRAMCESQAKPYTYLYDTDKNVWLTRPPFPSLNQGRFHHSSCSGTDGRAYIFGGVGGNDIYNSIEYYRPKPRLWEIFLPKDSSKDYVQRHSALMIYIDHRTLLILGGIGQF